MVLYTIVPEEIVLADLDKVTHSEEMIYRGKRILVQRLDWQRLRIVQLVSSDPADYLDNGLQPGTVITMTW